MPRRPYLLGMSLADKRTRLRAAHHGDGPLILPNAWDAASARVLAKDFAAIATGSHAVAASLGYDDGEAAPADEMFAAAARITRVVDVPVSVDVEAGYGLAPDVLATRLREAGAAGCNLEDTLHPGPGLADAKAQAERIRALRDADPELVINARADVFEDGGYDDPLGETVRRANLYLDAGADSIFPIMVSDERTIAALVERIPAPINILYFPGVPSPARLGELGVGRVTFGPGLHRATLGLLGDLSVKLARGEPPY